MENVATKFLVGHRVTKKTVYFTTKGRRRRRKEGVFFSALRGPADSQGHFAIFQQPKNDDFLPEIPHIDWLLWRKHKLFSESHNNDKNYRHFWQYLAKLLRKILFFLEERPWSSYFRKVLNRQKMSLCLCVIDVICRGRKKESENPCDETLFSLTNSTGHHQKVQWAQKVNLINPIFHSF